MLKENACNLLNLKSFQIDVSFKHVQGAMNKFEINHYNKDHKLILSYCRIFTDSFTAENYHRLFKGYILGDLDAAQTKGRDATSVEEVYNLLNEIEKTEEPGIQDWVEYYKRSYVLSSLNKHISKMNIEIWNRSSNNTNHVEASYANSNRDGKNLKLFIAIKREYQIDNRHIKISITYDNTGIPYIRRDRSEIKKKSQAMIRKKSVEYPKLTQKKAKAQVKLQKETKEVFSGSKNIKDTKKRRVEQENNPPVDDEKAKNYQLIQIKIEEQKMIL
ncbi:hypothetical protein RhiirA4_458890 [Rhizophagus irregularis]|uniref:Uncharacterized protein n=1 Tax=Rhizophagus irregularis TaxID=588596 RepID=A0A2I1GD47_9GLOM|nr:hypothetical protein RhiirA4_458890 [Rhizophagus irregularis]